MTNQAWTPKGMPTQGYRSSNGFSALSPCCLSNYDYKGGNIKPRVIGRTCGNLALGSLTTGGQHSNHENRLPAAQCGG